MRKIFRRSNRKENWDKSHSLIQDAGEVAPKIKRQIKNRDKGEISPAAENI